MKRLLQFAWVGAVSTLVVAALVVMVHTAVGPAGAGVVSAPGGGINATNARSPGLYLRTDGSIDFWDTPTAAATNAQPPSDSLTNLTTFLGSGRTNALPVLDQRGQITNAFKTIFVETNQAPLLSNIVAGASSGDVIQLGAGTFNVGLQSIKLPVGVTIQGQGREATVISGASSYSTNGPIIVLSSTSTVQNLSIICVNKDSYHQIALGFLATYNSGRFDPPAVGAVVRNVYGAGGSDVVFMSATNYFEVRFYDCFFASSWDTFIQSYAASGNASSNYVELWNCTLLADKRGSTYSSGYGLNNTTKAAQIAGTTRFYNCDVISTNSNEAWGIMANSYADITFIGGSIRAAGTNTAYTIDNISMSWDPVTAPIKVFNTILTDVNQAPGSIITYPPEQFLRLTLAEDLIVGTTLAVGSDLSVPSGTATALRIETEGIALLGVGVAEGLAMINGVNEITNGTVSGGLALSGQVLSTTTPANAQTGTTYTLVAADNGKIVTCNNAAAITVTVPSGLGAGFTCTVVQLGAGQVSFTTSGTTINSYGSLTSLSGQYAAASLVAYSANTFVLSGNLQ